ncbi:MAG: sulfatase-like hydrolase/transferase [Lentisphaerales bacterium]|nr:sulfatase-like hydrolase/transferase [Lentisphaerales bacterium]
MSKLLFSLIFLFSVALSATKKPNVILIMIDDMGYECVGAYGGTSYETPEMDRLAKDGVKFTNCHSTPVCTTSRVQIMTGKYNFRNYEAFGYLKNGETTFGNLMQQAGYKTMIAGKWQLNGIHNRQERGKDPAKVNEFGFDEYCLWQVTMKKQQGGERFWEPLVEQNGKQIKHDDGKYGPDIFTDYICDFMERSKNEPFFVYYSMVLVHDPFVKTPASENPKVKGQQAFADMMYYCDRMIGKIRQKLESLGLVKDTLILLTADNGTHTKLKSTQNGQVIKGGKGTTKDAGTHVPLIAYWQGQTPGGTVVKDLVDFTDILPTIVEAGRASLEKDQKYDGRSVLPQIKGQTGQRRDWVFCHYSPGWGTLDKAAGRWVQTTDYKLYNDGRFYDLKGDILEMKPLKVTNEKLKTIKTKLQTVLDRYQQEVPYEVTSRYAKKKKK